MRFFALVGYAYRWLKPKEPCNYEAAYRSVRCPLKRQILGHSTSNMGAPAAPPASHSTA
jgi:hypothetical protein